MRDTRFTDPVQIDGGHIRTIVEAGRVPTIQFSRPGYTPELLCEIDRLCVKFGNRLEVRFYGYHQGRFDASALADLPSVRWLSVDCLDSITNERQIGELPLLERLSFGVFRFDDAEVLRKIGVEKLIQLTLGENAKRNLDLAPLGLCQRLRTLFVNGHTKNIDVITNLSELTSVSLSGFPKHNDLRFLCDIDRLRSLTLLLGGRSSLEEFSHTALEELNVIRVRGLQSIGPLGRFPSLRRLQVEDQLQIQTVDLAGAPLQRISLTNCKNLETLNGLEALGELADFRVSRTKLDLDAFLEREWPKSLRILALRSSSQKWNDATRLILDRRGYREF